MLNGDAGEAVAVAGGDPIRLGYALVQRAQPGERLHGSHGVAAGIFGRVLGQRLVRRLQGRNGGGRRGGLLRSHRQCEERRERRAPKSSHREEP